MSRIAHYLQEHLVGEVTDSLDVRRYFSHDTSILQVTPSVVVYPANENDVRKTARFCWQLAERGKILPITPRGGGTDTSGAAIGSGVMMAFTAHMNRILALNPGKEFVTLEPGITFGALQQTLYTHGLFLPPYPASSAYATIGGGLANNSIGEKSVKYGDMRKYVEKLSVVLANGEIIETGPISKRELNRKMGLTSLEGNIYRGIDGLLEENQALLNDERSRMRAKHNRSGYNLFEVKKKGTFDLTPLFLGSQGTLGIITEATLQLIPHNPIAESLHLESQGGAKAVPVAEDVSVPIDRLADFMSRVNEIYSGGGLPPALWGHAGDGVVRMHPLLDLSQIGDRQKLYKLQDLVYNSALNMGGSISASAGDGRVRAPYMGHVYGKEARQLMIDVKQIFDPYGILNRGVKTATAEEVKSLMRTEYSRAGHEYLPHS
jgi:FAD/FMN-containing dehydrogenase